ncbi:MAG: Transcriptional repressor NrdR [Candidatus Woesebacteria bacterium GW2011_GWC1_42_9]|nr:MAG: Transcriptional repressor NrdR [Candidatus Woesebacteria bacterium GW2011_GWC1_42_9]
MKCSFCQKGDTEVVESRVIKEGKAVRRRRECGKCKRRFTTIEKPKEVTLWVIKKDQSREPFDPEKIRRGILRAIEKRPVSLSIVEDLVNQVEREMMRKESEEVSSRAIGGAILRRLKRIDKVAWLRFASVYMEFEDLEDFKRAI